VPAVRRSHINLLQPYLSGESPRPDGEWDMFCPLHEDKTRSAQVNVKTGVWYCQACELGGRVTKLIRMQDDWLPPGAAKTNGHATVNGHANNGENEPAPSEARIQGYMQALGASAGRLDYLASERGLDEETLEAYEIGWDPSRGVYTIPVRDDNGDLINVRRYNPNPQPGKRKIWGMKGWNKPVLWPISIFDDDPKEIIICGGEWDALITLQNGYPCVTRTGGEDTWDAGWAEYFAGKRVYLCHDMDEKGQKANAKIAKMLAPVVDEVLIVRLPYSVAAKHGKDLTDWWLEYGDEDAFRQLLDQARPYGGETVVESIDPENASVLDTFDSSRVGKPLRVIVTIKGKKDPGYSIPRNVIFECSRNAGEKCSQCPLNAAQGKDELVIEPSDPVVLEMIESTRAQINNILAERYGVPGGRCSKLTISADAHQAVETLFARPSVDHMYGDSSAYKNMMIRSVGRHDTQPNNTMEVVGALWPEPRKQMNEFLAHDINAIHTSLDGFELSDEGVEMMRQFRPRKGQTPLQRLEQIANDLSVHVTKIYGRPEIHMLMDLVFHSALAFEFGGSLVDRGWLEGIVVGDTRTGKSEIARGLIAHYRAGELVVCEGASFAGLVGGLQQYGTGKEWAISWGAIPLNDRRLVVLDEVSGLAHEDIARMSDVRSRGLAQLTKIQQEATLARVRLIWTGNPRDGSMADYTYGVQAIRPLIGNAEDVARFDLALSARMGEVAASEINRVHADTEQRFDAEACSLLLRWAWSRTADQIVWTDGAEAAVLDAANELGSMYIEDPPLVQVANVRIKIARVAVALATRLFSTDETFQLVRVRKDHVRAAVDFIHRIYSMEGFGYYDLSQEIIKDRQEASAKRDEVKRWLRGRPGLAKFLRNNTSFRGRDLEETMNMDREMANGVINHLWGARMVRRDKSNVRVEPVLHELLREVRE
jgi:hypothetical protein